MKRRIEALIAMISILAFLFMILATTLIALRFS